MTTLKKYLEDNNNKTDRVGGYDDYYWNYLYGRGNNTRTDKLDSYDNNNLNYLFGINNKTPSTSQIPSTSKIPTTPTTSTSNTSTDDIYNQQMSLATKIAEEQKRIANQSLYNKRQTLADQLQQQRQDYARNLALMNEDMYGKSRNLLSGLANRGLATSGLLQLGQVENQMAKGRGLSELAYNKNINERNIYNEQRQADNDLVSILNQAELGRQSMEFEANKDLYNRQNDELSRRQEIALSLLEAGASGALDEKTMSLYNQIMNPDATPEEISNIMQTQDFKDVTGGTDIGSQTETGILGNAQFDEKVFENLNPDKSVVNIGGVKITYDVNHPEEFNKKVQELYDNSDLPYAGEVTSTGKPYIRVDAGRGVFGRIMSYHQDIVRQNPFVTYDGKRFPTWNAAVEYLQSKTDNNQE